MNHKIYAAGLALLLPAALLPVTAHADTLGFSAGANSWTQEWDGDVQSGPDTIDLDTDLGLDDDTGTNFYIAFEHPIPLIPNVRLQHTELEVSASQVLSRDISFEGVTFPNGAQVDSNIDLTHTDITLYYEILDNWVSLDIGLTARVFEEGISIGSPDIPAPATSSASLDVDYTIPMLYGSVKFELPLTGMYVGARGNIISYSGDSITDIEATIGYETEIGLGLELGYRIFDIDYEDASDETADLSVDGIYFGVFYHL